MGRLSSVTSATRVTCPPLSREELKMEWEAFKKKQETEKAEASTVIKVWTLFHTMSTLLLYLNVCMGTGELGAGTFCTEMRRVLALLHP